MVAPGLSATTNPTSRPFVAPSRRGEAGLPRNPGDRVPQTPAPSRPANCCEHYACWATVLLVIPHSCEPIRAEQLLNLSR